MVSESSGVGTSNGSGSGESVPDTNPEAGLLLPGAGTTVVCMEPYTSSLPGHLSIAHGDIIEGTSRLPFTAGDWVGDVILAC